MEHRVIYNRFIEDRKKKQDLLEEFDRHHIVPVALGGSNDPSNLVKLSYSDHLFAHVLLAKIHGGLMLQCALRMSGMEKYAGRSSRRKYDHLRRAQREYARQAILARMDSVRERMKGNKHCVGRETGPETRARRQAAWTPEMREAQRQRALNRRRTPDGKMA